MKKENNQTKINLLIVLAVLILIILLIILGVLIIPSFNEKNNKEEPLELIEPVKESYQEIYKRIDTKKFDKNKFNGKFKIKKVNYSETGGEEKYRDVNYNEVDKYKYKEVKVNWSEIKNRFSDLYEGLNLERKIEYSAQPLYSYISNDETTFYLDAHKTTIYADETINESFLNNNVTLYWSGHVKAENIIEVSDKTKKKWQDNQLAIFLETLGEPSRFCPYGDNAHVLYWDFDEYSMDIFAYDIEDNESIELVHVISKKSNMDIGDYESSLLTCSYK